MASEMVLHAGARIVSFEELETIPAPESTKTWFPVPHIDVVSVACELLNDADFRIDRLTLAVARDDHRMFATLDLKSEVDPGVCLSVGVRSSTDKSFPLTLVAGSRVFVCDNLAFFGDINVTRKHTRNGAERWEEGIAGAISELDDFIAAERDRVELLRSLHVGDVLAHHIILMAMMEDTVNPVQAREVCHQWHEPAHDEFRPRNAWSLMNAFTEVMKPAQVRNFGRFALNTMKLYPLIMNHVGRN